MRSPKAVTLKRARSLRRTMTPPETRLWVRLRERREGRAVFRRQHPMGPYILDFYCPQLRLAIEVDGEIHAVGGQPDHDRRRDAWLNSQGVEVIRIAASEVLRDPDGVAEGIWTLVQARIRSALA